MELGIYLRDTKRISSLTDLNHSPCVYPRIFRVNVGNWESIGYRRMFYIEEHDIIGKSQFFRDRVADDLDNQPEGLSELILLESVKPEVFSA